MPKRKDCSPHLNRRDINELFDKVERLESIVEAFKGDLADPNEGEEPLLIPPIPRTLRELGIGTPEAETTDRDAGG